MYVIPKSGRVKRLPRFRLNPKFTRTIPGPLLEYGVEHSFGGGQGSLGNLEVIAAGAGPQMSRRLVFNARFLAAETGLLPKLRGQH